MCLFIALRGFGSELELNHMPLYAPPPNLSLIVHSFSLSLPILLLVLSTV